VYRSVDELASQLEVEGATDGRQELQKAVDHSLRGHWEQIPEVRWALHIPLPARSVRQVHLDHLHLLLARSEQHPEEVGKDGLAVVAQQAQRHEP
jgi:hypothetical protein